MGTVTKADRAGKDASKKIYIDFASRIAVAEGGVKDILIKEVHLKAIDAAQKISPKIDVKGVRNQLGSVIRVWRQKNPPAPYFTDKTEEKKDDNIDEESNGNGENLEERINAPPHIDPKLKEYIDGMFKANLNKTPAENLQNIVKVPNTPMDPNVIKEASQRVTGKVATQFEAVIEKIFLDDYRKALFSSWKSAAGYPGDLGDLIIEAFDLFFKIKGVDLELVSHTPLSVDRGRINNA